MSSESIKKAIENRHRILLITVLLIGIYLRFYGIDNAITYADDALEALQALNVYLRLTPSQSILPFSALDLLRSHSHPPVTTFVIILGWLVFGQTALGTHFFFALFSVLSIALMYKIGREAYSEKAGLVSAGLLSASFYHVNVTRFAIQCSPYVFFLLLAFLHLNRYLKSNEDKDFCMMEIFLAICAMTIQYSLLLVVLFNVFVFERFRFKPLKSTRNRFVLVASLLVWVPFYISYLLIPVQGDGSIIIDKRSSSALPGIYFNLPWLIGHLAWWTGPLLLAVAVIGSYKLLSKKGQPYSAIRRLKGTDRMLMIWAAVWVIPWTFFMGRYGYHHLSLVVPLVLLLGRSLTKLNYGPVLSVLLFLSMFAHTNLLIFPNDVLQMSRYERNRHPCLEEGIDYEECSARDTDFPYLQKNLDAGQYHPNARDAVSAIGKLREIDAFAFNTTVGVPLYLSPGLNVDLLAVPWYRFSTLEERARYNLFTFNAFHKKITSWPVTIWSMPESIFNAMVAIVQNDLKDESDAVQEEIDSIFCLHSNHNTVSLYVRCNWASQIGVPFIEGPNGTPLDLTEYPSTKLDGNLFIQPETGSSGEEVNLTLPIFLTDEIIQIWVAVLSPNGTVYSQEMSSIARGLYRVTVRDTNVSGTYTAVVYYITANETARLLVRLDPDYFEII